MICLVLGRFHPPFPVANLTPVGAFAAFWISMGATEYKVDDSTTS